MDETPIAVATVASTVPASGTIQVLLARGGMLTTIPVRPLFRDYADAVRVSQAPLPMEGTTGIVLFPNGDLRAGVWLGSLYASPLNGDARMLVSNDQTIDYYSHWSGYWSYLDKTGAMARQWPDATYFIAGSGNVLPTMYRQVVQGPNVSRVAFSFTDRVSGQAKPFYYNFTHAAGTSLVVDPSGSVSATGGASGSWSQLFGGTRLTIDKNGNLSTVTASGAALSMQAGGATIAVDASGNYTVTVPSGKKITFTAGGGAGDTLAVVSLLVAAFNAHTHPDPQGGSTGTPTAPWTAATIQSPLFKTDT